MKYRKESKQDKIQIGVESIMIANFEDMDEKKREGIIRRVRN